MSASSGKILVDCREDHGGNDLLIALSAINVPYDIEMLEIADVVISEDIALERKHGEDLDNSIKDGRLFDEATNLYSNYKIRIHVYEKDGPLVLRNSFNPYVAMGATGSIIAGYKCSVIQTANVDQTAYLIKSLWESSGKSIKSKPVNKKKKPEDLYNQQVYFISSFPGVGFDKAVNLIDRFETPQNIINQFIDAKLVFTKSGNPKGIDGQISMLEGFGFKTVNEIKQFLTTKAEKKLDVFEAQ